jgi:hypothetical protein
MTIMDRIPRVTLADAAIVAALVAALVAAVLAAAPASVFAQEVPTPIAVSDAATHTAGRFEPAG